MVHSFIIIIYLYYYYIKIITFKHYYLLIIIIEHDIIKSSYYNIISLLQFIKYNVLSFKKIYNLYIYTLRSLY